MECPLVVRHWADLQSMQRVAGCVAMATRNVSEYMLVLALCLVLLAKLHVNDQSLKA